LRSSPLPLLPPLFVPSNSRASDDTRNIPLVHYISLPGHVCRNVCTTHTCVGMLVWCGGGQVLILDISFLMAWYLVSPWV
jgi:hypothetical protein